MKKRNYFLLMFLLITVVTVGCSYEEPGTVQGTEADSNTGEESESSGGSTIKVGLDVDAGTADPRLSNDTSAKRVTEIVYDGLVRLNENLEPEPSLATGWENPDSTTWIFHLREGVVFHDGEPFTAEDVKYTFDTLLDPEFQAPYASLYEPIESIEVIDELQVQFNLKEPYAPLLSYMDIGIVPQHIGESNGDSLSNEPIGTGPYKLIEWEKNNKITFEANEEYWDGVPKMNALEYYIIPDNTTRVAALEAGDINYVHSPLSPQDIIRLKENDDFTVEEIQGLGHTYLNFNVENSILSDLKVRQAISHLVNKEVIASSIYQGMDTPGISPIVPSSWAFTEDIEGYNYDVSRAEELFAEAGWKDSNGDGILDKNGENLSITLSTHSEDPNRIQAVEYLQNEFSSAGIETEVLTNEWPTFQTSMIEGDFDIALLGWLNLVDPDRAMYNQFHSEGGSNYGRYNNPEVDNLLEEGRANMDIEDRAEIYKEAAQIVIEEVAYNVLLYQGHIAMYNKELAGFEVHPTGSLYSLKDAEFMN